MSFTMDANHSAKMTSLPIASDWLGDTDQKSSLTNTLADKARLSSMLPGKNERSYPTNTSGLFMDKYTSPEDLENLQ